MIADLHLAIAHHLLVFALVAIFAMQLATVRPGLDGARVTRLAAIDGAYGALALAVVAVGFARAVYGLKGWDYYSTYWVFWTKVGLFLLVGLLSIRPTLRFQQWRRAARGDARYVVPATEIAAARRMLHLEAVPLALIPIVAAMLARGIGQ